jgi:Ankyrin repeats (3 copies)/Domain of unknown function (DUF3471)
MRWLAILLCAVAFGQAPALDEELLTAARKGDLPGVKALLEKGASLEAKSRYGQTPLFFAARNGHEEVVKFLLAKGASTNVNDTFYKMSLLAATADKGYTAIVKALLDAGASGAGEALEAGAERGSTEMVAMVLATGKATPADLTKALTAAEQVKKPEVVELLTKAGAKPAPAPTAQIDAEILKRYVGTYKGDPIGEVAITLRENKLFLGVQGQTLEMGAFDETTFALKVQPGATWKFTVEGGKATVVTFQRGAQSIPMKRVEGQ